MLADGGEIEPLANVLSGRQNVLVRIFGGAAVLGARVRVVAMRIKHAVAACTQAWRYR